MEESSAKRKTTQGSHNGGIIRQIGYGKRPNDVEDPESCQLALEIRLRILVRNLAKE